jgi:sulfopyruvate decarboxylase alpha subunit
MHHTRLAQVGHFSLWLAVIVALGFAGQSQYSQPSCDGATRMGEGAGPDRWQDDLYDLLRRHNVTQFAYVPDAGHRILIDRSLADPEVHSVALTSEEEGVAMLAGADLGGARGVLLMQSSGTGNCVNMLSLIKGGRFPFLTLVSMRGDFGEGNPWQFPMGQAVQPVLDAMGVICLRIEQPEEVVPTVGAALTMVFQSGQAVAVLLTQKLLGAKQF